METKKCQWFAVVLPVNETFVDQYREYGHAPSHGRGVYQVDLDIDGACFHVAGKYGKALGQKAKDHAARINGNVIEVVSDYMFNTSDIAKTIRASAS